MPDEKAAASSPADTFYKPEAESAPAEETLAVTSESAPDTKSEGEEPETASGSEPEKNQEPKSPKAQARIKQLLSRNAELEKEIESLKKPAPKL
jgi:pyruvate/2-oxoacid:ferredoxin oxidoreductase beta subunit